MALNCSGSWEWWERKRPKQGTKANASLEDAATVCQHLCQLFEMQFFIFIMRRNLNAWHFLCGGLTLSPQILQWPLVCHWKATNLSVTTSDVSPVILPLAFQKQLLHSHRSQQINLCLLPAHRLLSVPPGPSPPPMPPLRSLATAFPSPHHQHCIALRLFGWILTKLFSCYPAVLIALFPLHCHTEGRKENTNNFSASVENDISKKPVADICMTDTSQSFRNLLYCMV